mmetsp:Transcript_39038/g.82098  ORF Transcript_39038/g.82098 Transcript_39038/m.82098 type:complete len:274 (-) Transcript_39038:133-954(-)
MKTLTSLLHGLSFLTALRQAIGSNCTDASCPSSISVHHADSSFVRAAHIKASNQEDVPPQAQLQVLPETFRSVNRTCIPIEKRQQQRESPVAVIFPDASITTRRKTCDTSISTSGNDTSTCASSDSFPVGSVVELYGRGSLSAVPAVVTEHVVPSVSSLSSPSSITTKKYNLQTSFTNQPLSPVASEFLHPYEIYAPGTEASCNISNDIRRIYMVPCTIEESFVKKRSGYISYRVSYVHPDNEEGMESKGGEMERESKHLPLTKVQRTLKRRR